MDKVHIEDFPLDNSSVRLPILFVRLGILFDSKLNVTCVRVCMCLYSRITQPFVATHFNTLHRILHFLTY